jgi:hypothetical protein
VSAALNMHWLVNAPYYSVSVNLNKNMKIPANNICVERQESSSDGNVIVYQECETSTRTEISFSFVLTSIESDSGSPPTTNVPLRRGNYSVHILNQLEALWASENDVHATTTNSSTDFWQTLRQRIQRESSGQSVTKTILLPLSTSSGFTVWHEDGMMNRHSESLEVSKRVIDSKALDVFSEFTVRNTQAKAATVRVTEALGDDESNALQAMLHSYSYSLIPILSGNASENEKSCMPEQGWVMDLPVVTLVPGLELPGSTKPPSHSAVIFSVLLPPQCTLVTSLHLHKRFLKREHIPTDASKGVHVPAGAVHWQWEGAKELNLFIPPMALISVPFPDASMPFNVITMVSTVFALLLGSMMNVLVRKSSLKQQSSP